MTLSSLARADAPVVRRFDEGLLWIHRPVRHNRIAAFELFLPGGASQESREKEGVTRLMSAVWPKGTEKRDALAIAQSMELLGAAFGVDAREDYIAVGGQVTTDRWADTFALFQEILLTPTFPEEEVSKEREALLNVVRTRHENIFNVAEERFRIEMFGDHPYGRPDEGTEESVPNLRREDLTSWHRRRLCMKGAVLVTVGQLPYKEIQKNVEGLVRAWAPLAPADGAAVLPPVTYPAQSRAVEDTRKFDQGYIMVGYPALPATDPDYPTVKLINALLGGGMSSPLFFAVRERAGLAYEVSSFYPSRTAGSALVIYAGTDPKKLDLAEAKIHEVLKEFLAGPPSESDVADAKNLIRGHYLMDHQTNARLAWYLGWWELLGKGHGFDTVYPNDISAVTPARIHALAQKIFSAPSVTVRVRSSLR